MKIQQIKRDDIRPDENQPRKYFDKEAIERLSISIKDNGIEQPLAVKKNNNNYIIIDGERRWRASEGIEYVPCIVFDENTTDDEILEYQLRTDCLKEELTVDELDKAIYRYSNYLKSDSNFITSYKTGRPSQKEFSHQFALEVGKKIGKSYTRVNKAIDRFEFKRDQPEFTKEITKKYNPENKPYSKVNSTIAMTDKLKDKPEVRKKAIEKILEEKKKDKLSLNNNRVERIIDIASKTVDDPEELNNLFNAIPEKYDKKNQEHDINIVLMDVKYKFYEFVCGYEKYEFEKYKSSIKQGVIDAFIEDVNEFLETIINLGGNNE